MAFPTNPSNNSTAIVNGIVYTYNSATSSWTRRASANTVGLTYTASNGIVPISPRTGDQWYNISEDVIYEYITDGTGFYWVDQSTPAITTTTSLTTALQNNQLSPFLLMGA
jgi:hypothetical protein